MVRWLQKIVDEQSNSSLSMEQANEIMQVIDREHKEAGLYIPQRGIKEIDEIAKKENRDDKEKYDVALYGATMDVEYGRLITYYALYRAVEKMGYSVGLILPPLSEGEEEEKTHATRFCEEYMNTCERFSKSEMKNLNDVANTFLLGSDQIWNYALFPERTENLYLDFINNKKKKIAYAASFGSDKPTIFPDYPERYPKIMSAISRFDAIAVSEESGVDICNEYYGAEAAHVMDPVFLLKEKDYEELAKNAKNKPQENYICVYALSSGENLEQVVETVSKELKLQCVNMVSGDSNKPDGSYCENLQMEEWLYNVMHSDFVVTDSYYGVCFSIIFKKKFVLIQDSWDVARIDSLLNKLGLQNHWFRNHTDFMDHQEILEQEIDYDKVYKRLNREAYVSQNWLKKALLGRKKVNCMDKMLGRKVDDSACEHMYSTGDASEYYRILDSLKQDLIIMITKKGKKDGHITKVNFFEDGEIDANTKEQTKLRGFSYIYDFGNETILKRLEEFSRLTYYFNETKFTCYSEGKSYEEHKKKTAEFIVEQGDKKDIYRTREDGLYTLVYSKRENRIIDYVYLNVSKGSELQVKHLLD